LPWTIAADKIKKVVLRLAPYLDEMKLFRTVKFVLCIRGYSNNTYDRMFNQMKLKYHKKDISSWSRTIETMGVKEHINILDDKESMFKACGAFLDKFYLSFKTNTIQRKNLFKVEDTDYSLKRQCATHEGDDFILHPMISRGQVLGKIRTDKINVFMLEMLKPPGLSPIKQVELYKIFRHFVRKKFWKETCPRSNDGIMS
jgi:hypothetical protein